MSSNFAEDAIILGQLAKIFFERWQGELMEKNSHRTEYFCNSKEFPKNYLDEPKKGESLYRYLLRLVQVISISSKLRVLKEQCLRSFLGFLRRCLSFDQAEILNLMFPEDMEIRRDNMWLYQESNLKISDCMTVTRIVQPSAYPIYVGSAELIIHGLVNRVNKGRPDRRQTSAEVLGICWLCFTAARLRIPVKIKELLETSSDSLIESSQYAIKLPTRYQELEIQISCFLKNGRIFSAVPTK